MIDQTELDAIEKRGTLVFTKEQKKEHTPLPSKGIVVAVGDLPDDTLYTTDGKRIWETTKGDIQPKLGPAYRVGDMILFGKYTGTDFYMNELDFRVVNANEVLCIMVDTDVSVAEVREDSL